MWHLGTYQAAESVSMTGRKAGITWLDDRIERGDVIILDGAMGTELQLRGIPMDESAWSGPNWLDHQAIVREVHEDYIRAGADIITTNTFCTARHVLEPAGFWDLVERTNRLAVELAREARDRAADGPVAIAGSISHAFANPDERYALRERQPSWNSSEVLRASYREQADLLKNSGVDLIILETMQRPETSAYALDAAMATGLPVWLGCSVGHRNAAGVIPTFNYPDVPFTDTLRGLVTPDLAAVMVMHTEIEDTPPALDLVRENWSGVVGAYPHSGFIEFPTWHWDDVIGIDAYLDNARGWVALGAQIVGGCCGIGPEHIRALKEGLTRNVLDRASR